MKKGNLVQIIAIIVIPGAIPAIIGYKIVKKIQEKIEKGRK